MSRTVSTANLFPLCDGGGKKLLFLHRQTNAERPAIVVHRLSGT